MGAHDHNPEQQPTGEPSRSRRRFLNRLTLAAGTVALGSPLLVAAQTGDSIEWRGERRWIRPGPRFFPQSVASFDPRPGSVLLWGRAQDEDHPGQDLPLGLIVYADVWMRRVVAAVELRARASDDGVVQVKLAGLKPRTSYYYRFVYQRGGEWFGSPLGRTRTAPRPDDVVPVRFAVANCQDATGRYYNTYFPALAQELDFVVHLGDYIYETTGDPSFQATSGRNVEFSDKAGAIALTAANGQAYYAAASLSNYRELYRFYRSDPLLQRMHERFPFVNIWDDHEYSDDCWGATGTYFDGRRDEADPPRRRNAERAFFEYIAVDDGELPEGEVDQDRRPLYPDARLYRDFRFGRNLHLVLTDSRSFRPDHLIPEDAFPGAVAVDKAGLIGLLGPAAYDALEPRFAEYVDMAASSPAQQFALRAALTGLYRGAGQPADDAATRAQALAGGKLDLQIANSLIDAFNGQSGQSVPQIAPSGDRGITFALLGKASLFSSLGARYFVAKDTYDLYAAYKGSLTPSAQNVYGVAQLAWLKSTLLTSDAQWKVVGNSTSLTSMVLDLTGETPNLPEPLKQAFALLPLPLRNRFYLNVDEIDGFPQFLSGLLDLYQNLGRVALIAGDIHGSFVTRHRGRIWEFTAPAVSSSTFRSGILATVQSDPTLSQIPGLAALVGQIDLLMQLANPEIEYTNTACNGVVVIEASSAKLAATFWQIDGSEATTSYYDAPWKLLGKLRARRFEVSAADAMAAVQPDGGAARQAG
jgi:alkaline phosphatase D